MSVLGRIPAAWGTAAFVVVVCGALAGLEVFQAIGQRDEVLADARKETANLTSSLVQHAELTFRTADALLIAAVERLEHEPLGPEQRHRLRAWFIEEVRHSSEFVSFSIIDNTGQMVISSAGENASADLSDREHFIHHRGHADRDLHIGDPVRGRSADGWLIPVTRRFDHPDGSFGGVVVAALSPKYFQDFYDRLEIGNNGAILLASLNAKLMVRRPFVEANVGRDMSQGGIFKQLKKAPVGGAEQAASIDGVRRINSYEQGTSYPLVVAVAKDIDELLAPWRRNALRSLGETGVVIALISILGGLVWQRTNRLAANAGRLREANARFDGVMNTMSQAVCLYDRSQRIVIANKQYADMYRLTPEQVRPGTQFADVLRYRRESGTGFVLPDENFTGADIKDSSEVCELADGRMVSIVRHAMDDGGWLAIHGDITARMRSEREITYLAKHDQLTGLPNRYEFSEFLEQTASRDRRVNDKFAVFMLDLDGFKAINDTMGHGAGDRLLEIAAQRIKACVRETDLVARLGGDEFAIVQLTGNDGREAVIALALRIVDAIAEPFEIEGQQAHVGVSVGVALSPEHGRLPEELMRKADLALYVTKAAGKNDFRIYNPTISVLDEDQRALELELREALNRKQFELHYQPLVDLKTGDIVGVEALVRWRHPKRGVILPDRFIPLAESSGFIVPLGEWILEKACSAAASWSQPLKVAVNISVVQLTKSNLFDVVLCTLVETGLSPGRLELELTESVLLDPKSNHAHTIRQLGNVGVTMVIDDFGTGYSSASYLTNFAFRKIKIDKSFVKGMTERRECAAVIASTLALAKGLGIETTAEGIETAEQMEMLRDAGVTFGQGFYFGRAEPCPEICAEALDRDIA